MIFWGAVVLSVAVGVADGAMPVRRIVDTAEAVYFEPAATDMQGIVWVYPKTKTVVTRYELDPAYLKVDRVLRDVQLPADLSSLDPSWNGKQALFYQVTSLSECVLKNRPEMRFVQQWVRAKGITIQGTQRSAICSFTFKLRPETPELIQQMEKAAAAGTLIEHALQLQLSVSSVEPIPWTTLHTALVSGGMEVGNPMLPQLAAFELGLLSEVKVLQSQPPEVKQSFLQAALQNLFGWDWGSPEVQLSPNAPAGQYEFPSVPNVIPL